MSVTGRGVGASRRLGGRAPRISVSQQRRCEQWRCRSWGAGSCHARVTSIAPWRMGSAGSGGHWTEVRTHEDARVYEKKGVTKLSCIEKADLNEGHTNHVPLATRGGVDAIALLPVHVLLHKGEVLRGGCRLESCCHGGKM
jgi:hypothetical protein